MKQTAVEWLIQQMQEKIPPFYAHYVMNMDEVYEQAKEMERKQMDTNCNQLDKPFLIHGEHQIQMLEISDEEIEKEINSNIFIENDADFYNGAKWYREQLKQK